MTQLNISQLFQPAASGVGPNVPPAGSWQSIVLSIAAQLGLPTTSWQPGAPERTILAELATIMSQSDAIVSTMAQGGFLDFAASGTVSYVALNGQTVTTFVTPDPSVPSQNSTGAAGWLDFLSQFVYGVTRLAATFASGPLALVNTSVSSAGPYTPGTFHISNTNTKATYANVNSLTIPSSIIGGNGGVITGVSTGSSTVITTQAAHGLLAGSVAFITGVVGVTGINGIFATVATVVSATAFLIQVATTGGWMGGGTVYNCTVAQFQADIQGIASNAAVGAASTTITQATGVSCFNLTSWSASNWESNIALAARCRLKLAAASPNGPSQAYQYFALTAQTLLLAQTPSVTLTNGAITAAITVSNPVTGVVTTTIASATPASSALGQAVTPGVSNLGVTNATNATPIVITSAAPHSLVNGNAVTIAGVLGNTAANGTWTITVLTSTTFSLANSSGNGTYTSGGTIEGGDLGQVDALLQTRVVPNGVIAVTQSALALPVTVTANVTVPAAFVASYKAAINAALTTYLATIPIGGIVLSGASSGIVPIAGIQGALNGIGISTPGGTSYVKQITGLTLNGSTFDLTFSTNQYQAVFSSANIVVIGV